MENGHSTNGHSSSGVVVAANRILKGIEFTSDETGKLFRDLLTKGFGDASLVDEKAGPVASATAACRKAVESMPASSRMEKERKLDYTACEVLAALWVDSDFIKAWTSLGHEKEVTQPCPMARILGGARFATSYGDHAAQKLYFSNFSRLGTHASMMADETRTSTYKRAIHNNRADFEGKVIMDVGSGSGILAFFACQAGAAKVYCIEASPMERVIRKLAEANGFADRIIIVNKVLQEIRDEVPEKVDTIISETLGNCLFAERGIETVIVAREKFLKPGGKLFPCKATLCAAPFSDEARYKGRLSEALYFWTKKDFHGLNMSVMQETFREETFKKVMGENFHPDCLKADAVMREFDFRTLRSEDLAEFDLDLKFPMKETCVVHGVATWFEAHFEGSTCNVILSTSPWDPLTHWWQTRHMLLEPLAVNKGQEITGVFNLVATEENTYECRIVMEANGQRLENGGMSLLDMDTGHRNVNHKDEQVSENKILRVPDYDTTLPKPTGQKELVSDPMKEAKLAAKQSEAGAAGRRARQHPDRPFGSQIKVGDKFFTLVDEPELLAKLSGPQACLQMIGNHEASMLMTPQGNFMQYLIQYSCGQAGVQPTLWMERAVCVEHMKATLCRPRADGSAALNAGQAAAMTYEQLWPIYAQTIGA